ncbi:hypothetical protein P389DRAFT_109812 [Cystobasidium minutum MCA 4210]|uniref:uncharacterized protein n=1 Tax=Cystobasidium minutum MCA 4210 TaxID=1397322 RepID=UPI0034CEBAB8|eukprot:jgi/Rhomi1/109812/CE109811_300
MLVRLRLHLRSDPSPRSRADLDAYVAYNHSARFNNPVSTATPAASPGPARQQSSPPPSIVPGTSTTRLGSNVTSTTLPFYSHHPMPAMPAGAPPLSRSTSPAATTGTYSTNVLSGASTHTTSTGSTTAASLYPPSFYATHLQQQQPQQPHHTQNRSWTNGAKGWLANLTGLSKPNEDS